MIYEFTENAPIQFPKIFGSLPTMASAHQLLLWGAASVVVIEFARWRKFRRFALATEMAFLCLVATAVFIQFWGMSDEVAINLEHAWNLLHHGRFSMSPSAEIDGTVESLFYVLLTPFAGTQQRLVTATFGLTLGFSMLSVLTLYLLLRRTGENPYRVYWVACLVPYLLLPVANGFGASFFVLLVALTMAASYHGHRSVNPLSALLCLARPDAILWALAAVVSQRSESRLTRMVRGLAWIVGASLAFYAFYWLTYGHARPTPVLNKTLSLEGYRALFTLEEAKASLRSFAVRFAPILALATVALVRSLVSKPRNDLFFMFSFVAVSLVYLLYYVAGDVSMGWYGNQSFRYEAGVIWALAVLAALQVRGSTTRALLRSGALVVAIALHLAWFMPLTADEKTYDALWLNREWAARAGYLTNVITKNKTLTIATSEMNTFGLMVEDSPVADYWAYTDRETAESRTCSGDHVHIHPRPNPTDHHFDLFWVYFTSISQSDHFTTIEQELATFHHFARDKGYRLGELPLLLNEFDIFLIRLSSGETVTYLVRQTRAREVIDTLTANLPFARGRERPTDLKTVQDIFNSRPLVLFGC